MNVSGESAADIEEKTNGEPTQGKEQEQDEPAEEQSGRQSNAEDGSEEPNVGGSEHLREQLVDRPVATGGPQLNVDDLQDLDETLDVRRHAAQPTLPQVANGQPERQNVEQPRGGENPYEHRLLNQVEIDVYTQGQQSMIDSNEEHQRAEQNKINQANLLIEKCEQSNQLMQRQTEEVQRGDYPAPPGSQERNETQGRFNQRLLEISPRSRRLRENLVTSYNTENEARTEFNQNLRDQANPTFGNVGRMLLALNESNRQRSDERTRISRDLQQIEQEVREIAAPQAVANQRYRRANAPDNLRRDQPSPAEDPEGLGALMTPDEGENLEENSSDNYEDEEDDEYADDHQEGPSNRGYKRPRRDSDGDDSGSYATKRPYDYLSKL